MPIALIMIGRFKPAWNELSEEEQAAFATRVGRAARRVGVTPVVGYKLTTQGSFLEIWEADTKETLETFMVELDALGYKKYYDQALMLGERAANWITSEASPRAEGKAEAAPGQAEKPRTSTTTDKSPNRPRSSGLDGAKEKGPVRKRAEEPKRKK